MDAKDSILKNSRRIGTKVVELGLKRIRRVHPSLLQHLLGPKTDIPGVVVEAFCLLRSGGIGGKTVPLGEMKIDPRKDPFHVFRFTGRAAKPFRILVFAEQEAV